MNGELIPVILWRGLTPPSGEGYGCSPSVECGDELVDCNSCHLDLQGNDSVHAIELR